MVFGGISVIDDQDHPVIDPAPIAELREMLGDETVGDIANEFRQTVPELLERIRAALASGDVQSCQIDAHGLKSAAASLGLSRFSSACLIMEMACKEGRSAPELQKLLPAIEDNVPPAMSALEQAGV